VPGLKTAWLPLARLLEDAKQLGFLGGAPVSVHIRHSLGFLRLLPAGVSAVADMGSGAGIPGLVMAVACENLDVTLIEASAKRARYLERAVNQLGLRSRVQVLAGRVEEVIRSPSLLTAFPAVTARSFGPPGATAECAAGLLADNGVLIVSERPDVYCSWPYRWKNQGLVRLGLAVADIANVRGFHFIRLRRTSGSHTKLPRQHGLPHRKPLF
jgi:hypothetical protein